MRIIAALALAALVQTPPDADPDSLVRDAGRLAGADTNEARFQAITAMLRERKLAFEIEPFTIEKATRGEPGTDGRNIVMSLGSGDDHLVIGAHFDAARLSDGTLSHGAVDNAASSIMLVRLAESLRTATLPMRVHFVWFDMEELGLRGSAAYAARHAARQTTAMLNFDINAYGDTILFGPSARDDNVALKRRLLTTCAEESMNCVAFPEMPPGDDRSFTARGIPTLSIATLPAVELHQLWLLVNAGPNAGLAKDATPSIMRTIHTPGDTLDKVDGDTIRRTLRLATALVRNLAAR